LKKTKRIKVYKDILYPISYKKYKRSKSIKIHIKRDIILVTLPYKVPYKLAEIFFFANKEKIKNRINSIKSIDTNLSISTNNYISKKEKAREIIKERVEFFIAKYGFSYNKIFIKNQKTKWGSCSSKKNLNFNYKVAFLPDHLRDYIVIHEICHLKEMNHSSAFWDLVSIECPNYKEYNKALKSFSLD